MKNTLKLLMVMVSVTFFSSCEKPVPKDLSKDALIPKPSSLKATGISFELEDETSIYVQGGNPEVKRVGNYLADLLRPATGFELKVKETEKQPDDDAIVLALDESKKSLGNEGYKLKIEDEYILLKAYKPAGLFYGVQTIRQLLPARIESKEVQQGPWLVASGTIVDKPAYPFRGAMLDVARHFFTVDEVKRFIDQIVLFKMNILHLHLTDDQGWRIEIKSWPRLTEISGPTHVTGGKGGFYTQEQYKEIVKYAQDRFVTIIPEIDMPGHTNAALVAYPELNPDNKAKKPYTGIDVGFSTLTIHKDITYKFIDDVIREVAALTPGPYIHIGGDEAHQTKEKDYIYFVTKVQDIVNSHGKQMVGWADIAAIELKPNSVPQFWQKKPDNALKAVKQNVKIIMSPAARMYLDLKYNKETPIGLTWAGMIDVKKGYNWDPENFVEGITKKDILGFEAPLWTETAKTTADIDYLVFPRLPGYAEIGWTTGKRSWDEYKPRIQAFKERFDIMGINYYKSPLLWPGNQQK